MLRVTRTITLSDDELAETFSRAPGPGGQNVNKVETAVQLRFDAANSPNLPPAVYHRLRSLAGRRMTREGVVIIAANRFRSRERNREDARQRLAALIRRAATPQKTRRPTGPSRTARRRRLETKKHRGRIKAGRGRVEGPE